MLPCRMMRLLLEDQTRLVPVLPLRVPQLLQAHSGAERTMVLAPRRVPVRAAPLIRSTPLLWGRLLRQFVLPLRPVSLLLPPLPLSGQGRARAPAASWSSTPTRRRGVAMVEPAEALGWLTRLPWGPHAQLRRCLSAATEAWSLSRRQGATSVAGRCRSGRGRCLGAMHNPPSQHDFRSCCCSSSSSNTKREVQGSGGHPDGYPVRSEAIRFGLGRQR
mmetsp:Transcript_60165/g.155513  ORF Transcript_60165/g.155513 Transcript_60165/m.155513 type:complete len:218 (-) Transcript_60165:20-673(-)